MPHRIWTAALLSTLTATALFGCKQSPPAVDTTIIDETQKEEAAPHKPTSTADAQVAGIAMDTPVQEKKSGEMPIQCPLGYYAYISDTASPKTGIGEKGDYPFSVDIQQKSVEFGWFDAPPQYIKRKFDTMPEGFENVVVGYDDYALGNFRIICGNSGSVVLLSDKFGKGPNIFKLIKAPGDIWDVAAKYGWDVIDD